MRGVFSTLGLAASGLAVTMFVASLSAGPVLAETVTPLRAADVRAGIGINTHVNYLDTAYARPSEVVKALKYIGVDQVREQAPTPWNSGSAPLDTYVYMAEQGIHFDFIALGETDFVKTISQTSTLNVSVPGAVSAIEGFNEIDGNHNFEWSGLKGSAGGIASQKALFAAVGKAPKLKDVPVYDITGAEVMPQSLAGRADFANAHLYPQNGFAPGGWFKEMAGLAKGKQHPLVITEFGYASNLESGWLVIGVGQIGQAKGILSGLFSGFEYGVARTYLYELFDQKPDPENKEREWHFGLYDNQYRAKVGAVALHNVTSQLNDPSANARSFAVRPFNLDLQNMPATGHKVVIEKADGTTLIVLWNEQTFWDRATGKALEAPAVPVTIGLPAGAKIQGLYDPLKGGEPAKTFAVGQPVVVDLPDHPVILVVRR